MNNKIFHYSRVLLIILGFGLLGFFIISDIIIGNNTLTNEWLYLIGIILILGVIPEIIEKIEDDFQQKYPKNNHIRAKIRQIVRVLSLEESVFLKKIARGEFKLIK